MTVKEGDKEVLGKDRDALSSGDKLFIWWGTQTIRIKVKRVNSLADTLSNVFTASIQECQYVAKNMYFLIWSRRIKYVHNWAQPTGNENITPVIPTVKPIDYMHD